MQPKGGDSPYFSPGQVAEKGQFGRRNNQPGREINRKRGVVITCEKLLAETSREEPQHLP